MKIKLSDIKFTFTNGKKPGGQHSNRTYSCVKATHIPTGISVTIDGRSQIQNKKTAIKELEKKVLQDAEDKKAAAKKKKRDDKIRNAETIRTYDYNKNLVRDHRSMKHADLKRFMKGKIDLKDLRDD